VLPENPCAKGLNGIWRGVKSPLTNTRCTIIVRHRPCPPRSSRSRCYMAGWWCWPGCSAPRSQALGPLAAARRSRGRERDSRVPDARRDGERSGRGCSGQDVANRLVRFGFVPLIVSMLLLTFVIKRGSRPRPSGAIRRPLPPARPRRANAVCGARVLRCLADAQCIRVCARSQAGAGGC